MIKSYDKSVSRMLSEFTEKTTYNNIPGDIINYTKERILDNIAAGLAGSFSWEYSDRLISGFLHDKKGPYTLIGKNKSLSCSAAAMVNTSFIHSVELDDGHKNAGVHAGAVVIPTALAVGEYVQASGWDILTAIVVGYDVTYRLARNLNPIQIQKGFHPSSTCGALGAAATAAKLLKLDVDSIGNAIGLAGLQAAGLMEATQSAQSTKCIMVGHASMAGILTAWLAKEGVVGPHTIFEGKSGLFKVMSDNVDTDKVISDLGKRYEITDTYTKLYPACRHLHAAVEGLIALQDEHRFSSEDIAEINVGTYEVAFNLTGTIYEPKDAGTARFSMPYALAVALKEGSLHINHLESPYLENEDIKKLAKLVKVKVDDEVNQSYPQKRGSRVSVVLKDKQRLEKVTYILKGSPELPVGWDDLHRKYMGAAANVMDEERALKLSRAIDKFEKIKDINDFTILLRK